MSEEKKYRYKGVCGLWENKNKDGGTYLSITLNKGDWLNATAEEFWKALEAGAVKVLRSKHDKGPKYNIMIDTEHKPRAQESWESDPWE